MEVLLNLGVDDNGYEFATSINGALRQANAKLTTLNETIDSIKELKPYLISWIIF